ncbi:Serine/threonine-protein phosphatase 2A activator, partial [Perkinsus chesapeaki]
YVEPVKRITGPKELADFIENSPAYKDIVAFLERLCTAVQGKKNLDIIDYSSAAPSSVEGIMNLLDILESWLDDLPPSDQPMRFGNLAFSLDSFGNATRIDYGTGHETAFMAFLMVLIAVGHFDDCAVIEDDGNVEEDILGQEIGLRIFPRYIALMRHIQKQYMLEPAGSHGVWGLDDYHHIPFLLGACQLVGSNETDFEGKPLTPERVVRNRSVAESIRSWSMFGEAVSFVYETKTGAPLAETSPMLWEISRIDSWERHHQQQLDERSASLTQQRGCAQAVPSGKLLQPKSIVGASAVDSSVESCGWREGSPLDSSISTSPLISFNVGGRIFQITKSTLDKYPSTVLADRWTNGEVCGPIFLDRNPDAFGFILDWYRNGRIVLPRHCPVSKAAVEMEIEYFGLPSDTDVELERLSFAEVTHARYDVARVFQKIRQSCSNDEMRGQRAKLLAQGIFSEMAQNAVEIINEDDSWFTQIYVALARVAEHWGQDLYSVFRRLCRDALEVPNRTISAALEEVTSTIKDTLDELVNEHDLQVSSIEVEILNAPNDEDQSEAEDSTGRSQNFDPADRGKCVGCGETSVRNRSGLCRICNMELHVLFTFLPEEEVDEDSAGSVEEMQDGARLQDSESDEEHMEDL